jgi:hypothetical protein
LIPGGGVKPQHLEVEEIYKEASKPGTQTSLLLLCIKLNLKKLNPELSAFV